MKRLSLAHVTMLHSMIIDATGGSDGTRDKEMLESAINMPFATFEGKDLYPSIETKAARLGFGLISNHPFIDGNKRIGLLAMLTFLELNGIFLTHTDEKLVDIGMRVAAGKASDNELLAWIKTHKTADRRPG